MNAHQFCRYALAMVIAGGAWASMVSVASAELIASESCASGVEGYTQGQLSMAGNAGVVVGNTGFSVEHQWTHVTSNIQARVHAGLSHSLLAGEPAGIGVRINPANSGTDRRMDRALAATPPDSPTYYLSGLVWANSEARRVMQTAARTNCMRRNNTFCTFRNS